MHTDIVGRNQELSWSRLCTRTEAANVNKVSDIVVLKAGAVQISQDIEIVEEGSQENLSVSVDDLDDDFMLVEDECGDIMGNPFDEVEFLHSKSCKVFRLERHSVSIDSSVGSRRFEWVSRLAQVEDVRKILGVEIGGQDSGIGQAGAWSDGAQA